MKIKTGIVALSAILILGALYGVRGAQAATPLLGWGWSDTIGWISLNCINDSTCATANFGLAYDGSGNVSGYAWSDSIGWISANASDLSGCPSGSCTARFTGDDLTGWMRALSHGDGWDGWISLSGTNYQVQKVNDYVTGWAWGSDVVGWIDFSSAQACAATAGNFCNGNDQMYRDGQCNETIVEAPCTYGCAADIGVCIPPPPATGELTVLPTLVIPGQTAQATWDTENTLSCTLTSTNGDNTSGGSTGSYTTLHLTEATTFTLNCTGYEAGLELSDSVTVLINPQWREY